MCPLRIILIFLSATLAGIFLIKNIKSSQSDLHNLDKSHEESSPSEPPRSSKISSAISSGFWTCVDMASGRYLWRNLVSSNPSAAASAKQS